MLVALSQTLLSLLECLPPPGAHHADLQYIQGVIALTDPEELGQAP